MVNKRSSIQKTTNSMIPFIWPSKKAKLFYRERNQNSGCLSGGAIFTEKGHEGTFWSDGNVLKCIWLRLHNSINLLKLLNYILTVGKFYTM